MWVQVVQGMDVKWKTILKFIQLFVGHEKSFNSLELEETILKLVIVFSCMLEKCGFSISHEWFGIRLHG